MHMRDVDRRKPGGSTAAAEHSAAPKAGKSTRVEEAHAASSSVPRLQLGDVKGGAQNVSLETLNKHPGLDDNRIGPHKDNAYATIHPTLVYATDGKPTVTKPIPAGAHCWINAGAITKIVCKEGGMPKHAIDCVYVFGYHPAGNSDEKYHVMVGAWMPATALPHIVDLQQNALKERIAHQRGDGHEKSGGGVEIRAKTDAKADGVADLYTYPKQTGDANMAKYYYNNLSLNLPATGTGASERFGVSTTGIMAASMDPQTGHKLDPYREFYPEEPVKMESIPLYKKGLHSTKPVSKMTFVYGYVKTDAGAKIFGWINKASLPDDFVKVAKRGEEESHGKHDENEQHEPVHDKPERPKKDG
jgi:hypothetical protein